MTSSTPSPSPHEELSTRTLKVRMGKLKRKYKDLNAASQKKPGEEELKNDYDVYRKLSWALDSRGESYPRIRNLERWTYDKKYNEKACNRRRARIRSRHRYRAEKEGLVSRGDGKEIDHTCGQKRGKGMKKCPLHYKNIVVRKTRCAHRKAENASCSRRKKKDESSVVTVKAYPDASSEPSVDDWAIPLFVGTAALVTFAWVFQKR